MNFSDTAFTLVHALSKGCDNRVVSQNDRTHMMLAMEYANDAVRDFEKKDMGSGFTSLKLAMANYEKISSAGQDKILWSEDL